MPYTKLFSSIVTSTIWVAPDRTRIVWITMLALADRHGEVMASLPGLARVAGVPVEDCEIAIAAFLAPDPYSRTPDDEGRRIEKIEGGWALINHAKYRDMASREDSKNAAALRQKRHRAKKERNATVTDSNASVTPSNATVTETLHIADAEAEAEIIHQSIKPSATPTNDAIDADAIYSLYPRKEGKASAIKAIRAALKTKSAEFLLEAVAAYAAAVALWPAPDRQFIPHPATWFNRGSYDDDRTTWQRLPNTSHANNRPNPRQFANQQDYSGVTEHNV